MSAYNVVSANLTCPNCSRTTVRRVQFKYGNTRQMSYNVGDSILWGGNDIGIPGQRLVAVDGAVEGRCPDCGFGSEWDIAVILAHDQIIDVRPASEEWDFVAAKSNFIVIDE